MLDRVFATKIGMAQAWTKQGKRVPVTRCKLEKLYVVNQHGQTKKDNQPTQIEVGYRPRRSSILSKPLRAKLEQNKFTHGVTFFSSLPVTDTENMPKAGDILEPATFLQVGDVVKVQGTTKGRGFAGAMKRHGFHGGPRTHGQSDRARAVGSIGAGTSPGRVWKGKKMPGHYGVDTQSVTGLVIVHLDKIAGEVWLSGPVPGSISSIVTIFKTGKNRQIEIDAQASGIEIKAEPTLEVNDDQVESKTEVNETE